MVKTKFLIDEPGCNFVEIGVFPCSVGAMLKPAERLKSFVWSALSLTGRDRRRLETVYDQLDQAYPEGHDAWGLDLQRAKTTLEWLYPIYRRYFRVRCFGQENIPDGPCIVISNHSGQIAIDAALISVAFALEAKPPRILRPMMDRFVSAIPFVGTWAQEGGAVLGDRQNCINLLNKGQSVLVFPEGLKGITKSPKDFYRLQKFTQGFYRMALATGIPIVPLAVVGAEEFYPFVYHARSAASRLGLPALPITPHLLPLPSPVDIWIGPPITPKTSLNPESPDKEVDAEVLELENLIKEMLQKGLEQRRPFWAIS